MSIEWKPKKRQCKAPGCGQRFIARRQIEWWCSPDCGTAVALAKLSKVRDAKAKKERAEHKKRKREVEPISAVIERVKRACHEYIKERDHGLPCISCGQHCERMEAGHYKAVGAGGGSPARFHPDNIHLQCHPCNHFNGGGNHYGYRPNLVKKIGEERVRAVEQLHAGSAKWDRQSLEEQRAWFAAEARRIRKEREQRGMV